MIFQKLSISVTIESSRQNMRAYQFITNNTCPNIYAELLLMARLDNSVRIYVCPYVIVVEIDDTVSGETSLVCKEH
jgi:hypothetical protein